MLDSLRAAHYNFGLVLGCGRDLSRMKTAVLVQESILSYNRGPFVRLALEALFHSINCCIVHSFWEPNFVVIVDDSLKFLDEVKFCERR